MSLFESAPWVRDPPPGPKESHTWTMVGLVLTTIFCAVLAVVALTATPQGPSWPPPRVVTVTVTASPWSRPPTAIALPTASPTKGGAPTLTRFTCIREGAWVTAGVSYVMNGSGGTVTMDIDRSTSVYPVEARAASSYSQAKVSTTGAVTCTAVVTNAVGSVTVSASSVVA